MILFAAALTKDSSKFIGFSISAALMMNDCSEIRSEIAAASDLFILWFLLFAAWWEVV